MSSPDRRDTDPGVAEAAGNDPRRIAEEQFAHGLLRSRALDGRAERERRIGAVLAALDGEVVERHRWRIRPMRVLSGMAAVLAIAALVVLGMPNTRTAAAVVQASLAASKTAGDRRYEMHAEIPEQPANKPGPKATVDIRDADHMLIQATSPYGDQITIGRNEKGAWIIRPDGTLDRYPPRQAWPRWVNFGSNTVLLASVDELLEWLQQKYKLTRPDDAKAPSGAGPSCERVSAVRRPGAGPEPDRVELWIDPGTHMVRRMELHWDTVGRLRRPGPPHGVRDRDGMEDRPPPPRPEEEHDRPPPPEGDDNLDPPPPPDGDLGPPPGGVDREGSGGPPRRRPPPPGGRRPPPPPHPRPEFLGGPPDFAAGRQPPPPPTLVFELVDGVTFESGWFEPKTHEQK